MPACYKCGREVRNIPAFIARSCKWSCEVCRDNYHPVLPPAAFDTPGKMNGSTSAMTRKLTRSEEYAEVPS